jgi:hypothetical protein
MYRVSCLFDRSAHLFVDLPARSAILNGIQAASPARHKLALLILRILKALGLDVFVPGVFRVPIKGIVMDGQLTTDVLHDVWGSRPACAVHADRQADHGFSAAART